MRGGRHQGPTDAFIYCGGERCHRRNPAGVRFCTGCGESIGRGAIGPVQFGPVVLARQAVPLEARGALGEYLLLSKLGEGGMGSVYKGMQPLSGQHFALKVLNRELRLKRGAVELLAREAETQSRIVDPRIVRVFRFMQERSRSALVLELVNGAALDEVLRDRAGLRRGQLLWLAREMALGIDVIHRHGFVHADIKPSNFLFGTTDAGQTVLKVADFGIARRLERELVNAGNRIVAGTPGYMPPEQIFGHPLNRTSDLYSLGCVYYQLITGQPVFPYDDMEVCIRHHATTPAPSVRTQRSDLDDDLVRLVDSMLLKDPNQRPQSAAEVAARLREVPR